MRIGQISFIKLTSAAEKPYGSAGLGSKYLGQVEPTASRFYQDFEEREKEGKILDGNDAVKSFQPDSRI